MKKHGGTKISQSVGEGDLTFPLLLNSFAGSRTSPGKSPILIWVSYIQ